MVVAVVLLGACGAPEYNYLKRTSDGVFLKLPASWTVYDEREFWEGQGLSPAEVDDQMANGWVAAFDADPSPSMAHVAALVPDHVTGVLSVRSIPAEQRDTLSLKSLRSAVVDLDTAVDEGTARLIKYDELDLSDGFRGIRVVYRYQTKDGPAVFDQITAHDGNATKLYNFVQTCSLECYQESSKAMDKVAATWTLRNPR